jgi:hypothetical protein
MQGATIFRQRPAKQKASRVSALASFAAFGHYHIFTNIQHTRNCFQDLFGVIPLARKQETSAARIGERAA